MHRKSPHIELKKIDAQKDSKSSKASRRRKNREAAQAERQAKKELRESKAKDLKTADSYPVPDRFKAFTIGDRHLVFDKAQRKPSEGSNTGYDGPPARNSTWLMNKKIQNLFSSLQIFPI